MGLGHIPNYRGSNTGIEYLYESDGSVFVKIYNDGATALSRGVPYEITFTVSSAVVYADVVAPGTVATGSALVGVVNNIGGTESIAAYGYGYMQIAGYCPYVVTSGTPAANAQLEVLNSGVAMIDAGAVGGANRIAESVGVLVKNITTDVDAVYLWGQPVVIQAA